MCEHLYCNFLLLRQNSLCFAHESKDAVCPKELYKQRLIKTTVPNLQPGFHEANVLSECFSNSKEISLIAIIRIIISNYFNFIAKTLV